MAGFVQILLCWDSQNQESVKMVEKLRKGFDKMGCWHVELPPIGSTYKMILTVEDKNMPSGNTANM